MCSRIFFFMVVAIVFPLNAFAADLDLSFQDLNDELLWFDDDEAALAPLDSVFSLPMELGSSDFSVFDDPSWSPTMNTDASGILPSFDSDLLADCSSSDDSLFSIIGKPRVKRESRCGVLDYSAPSSPTLSLPTIEDLDVDVDLRENILRENPAFSTMLEGVKKNEFENNICILLSANLLPFGACTSTVSDWLYLGAGRPFFSPPYLFTFWDVPNVTPGTFTFV